MPMVISGRYKISVNRIIKGLVPDLGNSCTIGIGDREHTFRLEEHQWGVPYMLIYTVEDDEGHQRKWKWPVVARPSNLPGVDGVRYYLSSGETLVQCLHYRSFVEGHFFYIRHQYRHIYASQDCSHRQQALKYHDYQRKIDALLDSKKKLRLVYAGKPTRTRNRLDHYWNMYEYYEGMADQQLMQFIQMLDKKCG